MKSLGSEQRGRFTELFDHWQVIYQWDPAEVSRSVPAKAAPKGGAGLCLPSGQSCIERLFRYEVTGTPQGGCED